MTANDSLYAWQMSCDNPTRARYNALSLWKQGLRASDRDAIILCYGYSEHDADILCEILQRMENGANVYLQDYNPDIGF